MEDKHRHFAIHKPHGYLTQFIYTSDRKKMKLLGELGDFPEGIMAIGRLDKDSEGLLLLTTEGMMSERVRSNKVEKEYYVQVDGIPTEEAMIALRKGVEIGFKGIKYQTLPCEARILEVEPDFELRDNVRAGRHRPSVWLSITVREGKFRQVRKMTAAVGFPTLRLVRVRVGGERLDDLKSGEFREVVDFKLR